MTVNNSKKGSNIEECYKFIDFSWARHSFWNSLQILCLVGNISWFVMLLKCHKTVSSEQERKRGNVLG